METPAEERSWNGPPAKYRAGFSRRRITPTEPVRLGGYAMRLGPQTGVLHELEVRAMVVSAEDHAPVVLVSAELLGISAQMADDVREAAARMGIPRENIVLAATHTHCAPVTCGVAPLIYQLSLPEEHAVRRYSEWVTQRIVDALREAMERRLPAKLSFGQSLAGIGVNRRRARPGCRQLPAPVDHDVPVLAAHDSDGRLLGVVFGYACHATVLGGQEVSGDFPGIAQADLESRHPGSVAMFVPGCGGDINPLPRGSAARAARAGTMLADAVDDVLWDERREISAPICIRQREIILPYARIPSRADLMAQWENTRGVAEWLHDLTTIVPPRQRLPEPEARAAAEILAANEKRLIRHHLDALDRGGLLPGHATLSASVWKFGRELTVVFLGGEPVVDYGLALKARLGWESTWVSGYCNDLLGYLPSVRVLREGHYEGTEGMRPFGHPAAFAEEVESRILSAVEEMAS